MPIGDREYPTIKGEDAVRFLNREREIEDKLRDAACNKIDSLIDYQPLSEVCKSCQKAGENGICTGHSGTFYKEMCPLSEDFKGVNYG